MEIKRLLLGLVLSAAACGVYAEPQQALVLHSPQGATIVYALAEEPVVTFEADRMVVTTAQGSQSHAMADIDRWTVEMRELGGLLAPISDSEPLITVNSGRITVACAQATPVAVYTIAGVQVGSANAPTAEFELPAGVYVLTVGTKSFKVLNSQH